MRPHSTRSHSNKDGLSDEDNDRDLHDFHNLYNSGESDDKKGQSHNETVIKSNWEWCWLTKMEIDKHNWRLVGCVALATKDNLTSER